MAQELHRLRLGQAGRSRLGPAQSVPLLRRREVLQVWNSRVLGGRTGRQPEPNLGGRHNEGSSKSCSQWLMQLTVFSHKPCWSSAASPSGYATDGGFAFQMRALSQLFRATRVVVPCGRPGTRVGEIPLTGQKLTIVPLTMPPGVGLARKSALPFWMLRNGATLLREAIRAQAVHAVIPGDIGTLGMLLAWALRKRLLVRHCGNWFVQRTTAERFWHWFIERCAGGRNVMLVTGGGLNRPSRRNEHVHWVFSTSLTTEELTSCAYVRDGARGGSPRLVTVGRQDPQKGTGIVIRSLPLLLDEYPGAELHVVGDGPALAGLQRLAAETMVERQVVFHGLVDHEEVLRQLRAADLFCLLSASEGFPKVVLEALACGLPVITTRVSVLPHLLATGCGALLEDASPEAIARAVRVCLGDSLLYRTMSERAVRTARDYSLERWRDMIGDFVRPVWGPLAADA
jgi:glycosyltransferase involved in cell wall biosynthesis